MSSISDVSDAYAAALAPLDHFRERAFAGIVDLLDSAADLSGYKLVSLFADRYPDGLAEHAIRTWAGSRNLKVAEYSWDWDGKIGRTIEVEIGANGRDGVISLQWGAK
jgi:hypothetical protein